MPAQPSVADTFTFVGGLNTEGGYFVTPKNQWKEGDNIVPNTDGVVERRKGIDLEDTYQLYAREAYPADVAVWAYCVDTWLSVGGRGNLEFFVVQEGPHISFYRAASGTVSATKSIYEINLEDYKCFGNQSIVGSSVIATASCYGNLIITNVDCEPILVTYNLETEAITAKKLALLIRDVTGIRSPIPPQAERTALEWVDLNFWPQALYNLYNQGWKDTQLVAYTSTHGEDYPANTKQWYYGKDTNDNFDTTILDKQDFGTSLAPKGRFIIEAFYQDRAASSSTVSGTTPTTGNTDVSPNINADYTWTDYRDEP